MARLKTLGFETDIAPMGSGIHIEGAIKSGSVTRDSTVKRTGGFSLKCHENGIWENGLSSWFDHYQRVYFRISGLPNVDLEIARIEHEESNEGYCVRLTTTGKIQLWWSETAKVGSDSVATIEVGKWYRLEFSQLISQGASQPEVGELFLDGVLVAREDNVDRITVSNWYTELNLGFLNATVSGMSIWFDDYASNDGDETTLPHGYPGHGEVHLLLPASDVQRGDWLAGAGGTTNLWEAINNLPPIGSASPTNTSQIKTNGTQQGATEEYRVKMQTYASKGLVSADEIKVVQPFCIHAEEVSAGSKNGNISLFANPDDVSYGFIFGEDAGGMGTYPTNWRAEFGVVTEAPTLDVSDGPTVNMRKSDSLGTRYGHICLIGVYVEVRPVAFEARYNSDDLAQIVTDFQRSDLSSEDNELADAIWRGGLNRWASITPQELEGDPDVRVIPIVARAAGARVTIDDMSALAGRLADTYGGNIHNQAIKKDIPNTGTVF